MRPIAKSAKRQVRSTESSHIVNTRIRLSRNAVPTCQVNQITTMPNSPPQRDANLTLVQKIIISPYHKVSKLAISQKCLTNHLTNMSYSTYHKYVKLTIS